MTQTTTGRAQHRTASPTLLERYARRRQTKTVIEALANFRRHGELTADGFIEWIVEYLDRDIDIEAIPLPITQGRLCGLWIPLPTVNHVYINSSSRSVWYQNFTLFHEFGHMLCDHLPSPDRVGPVATWVEANMPAREAAPTFGLGDQFRDRRPNERQADVIAAYIQLALSGQTPRFRIDPATPAAVAHTLDAFHVAFGMSTA